MELLQFIGTLALSFVIVFTVGMTALLVLFKLIIKVDEGRSSPSFRQMRYLAKQRQGAKA